MPTETETTAIVAQDGFDEYYTEKLWSWIPGLYHEQDQDTPTPGTLREIVESMGAQSADLRRTLDRIWENFFVELADDEALEALGELVATRMVHGLNRRARRVDVARTIYYRRRKGTPRVLESLITDITGWAGAHLETRKRLARTYHLLEPGADMPRGMFTQTPRGGWADLRSARIPALAWSAFEELNHTPDFRRHSGKAGRVGIPRVNVHLHRARAFKVTYPTVVEISTGVITPPADAWNFALDPSGRAVALFQPADRPTADSWARMREWQMPRAIDCRLLDHSEFEWSTDDLATLLALAAIDDLTVTMLEKYAGYRIPNLHELMRLIQSLGDITINDANAVLQTIMVSDCGRSQLYGENQALALQIADDNDPLLPPLSLSREQIQVGNLRDWGTNWDFSRVFDANDPGHHLVVDPALGTVISQNTSGSKRMIAPVLYYGFPGEVGAGTYDRRDSIVVPDLTLEDGGDDVGRVTVVLDATTGVEELTNSKTFEIDLIQSSFGAVEDYRLQAKNLERPYLLYSDDTGGQLTSWTITAAVKEPITAQRCLVLDGLWIGLEDTSVGLTPSATATEGRLILAGTWDRVEIRHCTLDPGGELVPDVAGDTKAIQYVTLEIAGYVEELIIDHSIVGPIVGTNASVNGCDVGKLTITDSLVLVSDPNVTQAIDVGLGEVHLERSTVTGGITANRLYASDSFITGEGTITDLQHGCFRFSAGVEGGWPRPYESYLFLEFDPVWFHSSRFGDSDLLRLTDLAPAELRAGAENHCEMGVWNHLLDQIKRADLRAKFGEFMPFDLIMQLVTEN